MIIHIEICDVCKLIVRGRLPVTTYTSGDKRWDVCRGCDEKPFRLDDARWHKETHPCLLSRVDSLIVGELSLAKDPT